MSHITPQKRISAICAAATGLITLLVYLRALSCGFVNLDDPDYILNNPLIRHLDFDMLMSAFSQAHLGWWMPLTWVSFAVDYHFWGLNPLGYHLTNIMLHAVNTGLVVLIADRVTRQGPWTGDWEAGTKGWIYPVAPLLAGILWGIHPLRVESVAWVTERKDVLNGLFSLGCVYFYFCYVQLKNGGGKGTARAYILSLLLFALSLMAKSVSVVLPLMLLVIDWYPLQRLRRVSVAQLLLEKIPFITLSIVMAFSTVYFTAQSQYLINYEMFPFSQRLVVSGNAIFEYLRLLLFPVGLIAFYVIPDPIPIAYTVTSAFVIALCVVIFIFRKHRWLPVTWLCFVIPLLPVLAFLQNGDQSFAARFTYLSAVAPSIAAAFIIVAVYVKATRTGRHIAPLAVAATMAGLMLYYGVITVRLIASWKDSDTLWSRMIDLQPGAIVYKERGIYYYSVGKYSAAINDFSTALKIAPKAWHPYLYNLLAYRGESLRSTGRYAEAIQDFTAAIVCRPLPAYYHLRGLALKGLGRSSEAEEDFRRAGPDPEKLGWQWIRSEN